MVLKSHQTACKRHIIGSRAPENSSSTEKDLDLIFVLIDAGSEKKSTACLSCNIIRVQLSIKIIIFSDPSNTIQQIILSK